MTNIINITDIILAAAAALCFTLLMSRVFRRVSGLDGLKGTAAGLGGAAVFTGLIVLLLRKNIRVFLAAHPYIACVIYLSLLAVMIKIFLLTRPKDQRLSIEDLDGMDGLEFEDTCALLLFEHGFTNIEQTKASGDFGIDILAERDGLLYGIQCKRYNARLGSQPIQEAAAGLAYYGCDAGAVMTNSDFTTHAEELAEAVGIELWDREVLKDWLREQ